MLFFFNLLIILSVYSALCHMLPPRFHLPDQCLKLVQRDRKSTQTNSDVPQSNMQFLYHVLSHKWCGSKLEIFGQYGLYGEILWLWGVCPKWQQQWDKSSMESRHWCWLWRLRLKGWRISEKNCLPAWTFIGVSYVCEKMLHCNISVDACFLPFLSPDGRRFVSEEANNVLQQGLQGQYAVLRGRLPLLTLLVHHYWICFRKDACFFHITRLINATLTAELISAPYVTMNLEHFENICLYWRV